MVVPPVPVNFMNLKIDGGKKRQVYGVIVIYITIILLFCVYVGDMFLQIFFIGMLRDMAWRVKLPKHECALVRTTMYCSYIIIVLHHAGVPEAYKIL